MRTREALLISGKELREILRDRRALFFAFVLPLLLYPALFFAAARLEGLRQLGAAAGPSRVGLAVEWTGSGEWAGAERELFLRLSRDPDLLVVPAMADWGLLEREEVDAMLVVDPAERTGIVGEPLPFPRGVTIYYRGFVPSGQEAFRRLEKALDEVHEEILGARFAARGALLLPGRRMAVVRNDLAGPAERAGSALGKLLPFLLVALLLTGGAFAAIDSIAGEKERGTLETLFVQPVEAGSVVLGKFLAVLCASLAAVFLNLAGMAIAAALGLGPPGAPASGPLLPGTANLAAALVLVVPLAVLTSAALLGVSAHARSFREAQMFLLPLTLVAMLPALLAALPDVRLSAAVSVIPVASTTLAIREALVGDFRWGLLAAAFASTALYAALALRWAARSLSREDLRLGLERAPVLGPLQGGVPSADDPDPAAGAGRARRGIVFGALMVLLVAYAGTALQRPDGPLGIFGGVAVTLWVFVLLPPLLYLRLFRLPFRRTLALRAPRPRDVLATLLLVPAAAALMVAYMAFQDSVMPFPEGLRKELERAFAAESLGAPLAALLLAVSPAICEEVLWRGVVQGEVEAEGRPWKTVVAVGILFGVFHLDVYRLLPTAMLGALLAYLRLETRSIVPCVLFHGLYNAAMVFGIRAAGEELTAWAVRPPVALLAALLLAAAALWIRRGERVRGT